MLNSLVSSHCMTCCLLALLLTDCQRAKAKSSTPAVTSEATSLVNTVEAGATLEVTTASQVVEGDLDVQGTLRIMQSAGPSETVVHGNMTLVGTLEVVRSAASVVRQVPESLDVPTHTLIVGGVFQMGTAGIVITPDGWDAPTERYVLPSALPVQFSGQTGGKGGDLRIEAQEIIIESCRDVTPRYSLGNGGNGADVTVDDSQARMLGGQGRFIVSSGDGGESGQLILVSDKMSFRTCEADDAVILDRAEGGNAGSVRWLVSDDHHWSIPDGEALALIGGFGGDGMRRGGAGGSVEYVSGKSVSDRDGPNVTIGGGSGGRVTWRPSIAREIPKFRAAGARLGAGGAILSAVGNDGASALPSGEYRGGGAGGRMAVMLGSPGTLGYPLMTGEPLVGEHGAIRGPLQAGRGGEGLDMCESNEQGGIGGNGGALELLSTGGPVTVAGANITLAVGGVGGDGNPGSVGGDSGTFSVSGDITLLGTPVSLPEAAHGTQCGDVPPVPEEDPPHDTSGLPPPAPGSQFVFFDGRFSQESNTIEWVFGEQMTRRSTSSAEEHVTNVWPEQNMGRRTRVTRSEGDTTDSTGRVISSSESVYELTDTCDYINKIYSSTWRHVQTDRVKGETFVQTGTHTSGNCDLPKYYWNSYTLHQCYESGSQWVYVGANHSSTITRNGRTDRIAPMYYPSSPQRCTCRTFTTGNGDEMTVPDCQ